MEKLFVKKKLHMVGRKGNLKVSQKDTLRLMRVKPAFQGACLEFCWVCACIGSGVAFETIKLSG